MREKKKGERFHADPACCQQSESRRQEKVYNRSLCLRIRFVPLARSPNTGLGQNARDSGNLERTFMSRFIHNNRTHNLGHRFYAQESLIAVSRCIFPTFVAFLSRLLVVGLPHANYHHSISDVDIDTCRSFWNHSDEQCHAGYDKS